MSLREPLRAIVAILVSQVISQGANSLLKRAFGRPRPYEFIGKAEREKSYPSGHAVTAIVFYGGLAVVAAHVPLPVEVSSPLVAVLLVCTVAIPWSRVALGAHYLTDVIGGCALGLGWLCATLALYPW